MFYLLTYAVILIVINLAFIEVQYSAGAYMYTIKVMHIYPVASCHTPKKAKLIAIC